MKGHLVAMVNGALCGLIVCVLILVSLKFILVPMLRWALVGLAE